MSASINSLKKLKDDGYLRPLDIQLADLVDRMVGGADEHLLLAVALASHAIGLGNACVDLKACAGRSWVDLQPTQPSADAGDEDDEDFGEAQEAKETPPLLPVWEDWETSLKTENARKVIGDATDATLLVLNGSKLYLRRYWNYERSVESSLKKIKEHRSAELLSDDLLKRYFSDDLARPPALIGQQRKAARNGVSGGLSILSGGPGTGKTYTLARAVALMAERSAGQNRIVQIAAPTGKASQRVVDSIRKAKAGMKEAGFPDAVLQSIPEEACTIHRLLGARYGSPYFKHDKKNPLTANLVIIDEASMVDLPLMAKLLEALPKDCSLMLVGDSAQLASVEPGRVYGDICHAAAPGGALDGCLTTLTESTRFPSGSPIGLVSQAIHDGSAEAWNVLHEQSAGETLKVYESQEVLSEKSDFAPWVKERFASYLQASTPKDALAAADGFRVLCALRKGPYGVNQMNKRIEKILGLPTGKRFYGHQLVLVTANTPALELFNGDVGVVLEDPADDGSDRHTGRLKAWFPSDDPEIPRSIPVNLLPEHETAFAMTVHKSQGSEFPNLAVVLPPEGDSPVLTRELVYTALTRVKISKGVGGVHLYCTEASFKQAVDRITDRTSGLFADTRQEP